MAATRPAKRVKNFMLIRGSDDADADVDDDDDDDDESCDKERLSVD